MQLASQNSFWGQMITDGCIGNISVCMSEAYWATPFKMNFHFCPPLLHVTFAKITCAMRIHTSATCFLSLAKSKNNFRKASKHNMNGLRNHGYHNGLDIDQACGCGLEQYTYSMYILRNSGPSSRWRKCYRTDGLRFGSVSPRESGSFIPTKYPTVGIEQLPILRTSHFQFDISLSLASDKCVPSTLAYDHMPYWYLNGACPSFLIQPASDRDDPIRTICLNWRHWHWQNDKTGSDHANCSVEPCIPDTLGQFVATQVESNLLYSSWNHRLWRWRCAKFGIRKLHQRPQFRKDSVLENAWKDLGKCKKDGFAFGILRVYIYREYNI